MDRFADRVNRVPPTIMIAMAETAQKLKSEGVKVIDLALGAPEIPPPDHILEAIKKAAHDGQTGFYPLQGLPDLRQAIADTLKSDDGSDVSPQEIIVCCGVKQATFLAVMSIINNGDEVIVPDPCFPAYNEVIATAGGVPVPFPINSRNSGKADSQEIEKAITNKTKMIILNYPNNPSGWVPSKDELRKILVTARNNNITVFSDEIYEKTIFDDNRHYHLTSFQDMRDMTITSSGFSKTYSMVAYRIGYFISDKKSVQEAMKLMRCTTTMVPYIIQKGALAALQGPQDFVIERTKTYKRRRDFGLKKLAEIGFPCGSPAGTFYLFPDMSRLGIGSMEFCKKMLAESHVSFSPGIAFGEKWDTYFRISLAAKDEQLETVFEKISEMASKYTKR